MELFKYLICSWDVHAQEFRFWGHILEIKVKYIYFFTILSRRGAPISLLGGRHGGEKVKDYIATYYRPRADPTRDGKINIKYVTQLPLRIILFSIMRLVGTSTLHVASRLYMHYGVECLEPTIFN